MVFTFYVIPLIYNKLIVKTLVDQSNCESSNNYVNIRSENNSSFEIVNESNEEPDEHDGFTIFCRWNKIDINLVLLYL